MRSLGLVPTHGEHMMKTTKTSASPGLVALLLIAGFGGLLGMPTAAAGTCSADWNGDINCRFSCNSGDVFGVTGHADGDIWGYATCGNGSAECDGPGECV